MNDKDDYSTALATRPKDGPGDSAIVDWLSSFWNSQHTGEQYLAGGRAFHNPDGSFRSAIRAAMQSQEKAPDAREGKQS